MLQKDEARPFPQTKPREDDPCPQKDLSLLKNETDTLGHPWPIYHCTWGACVFEAKGTPAQVCLGTETIVPVWTHQIPMASLSTCDWQTQQNPDDRRKVHSF